MPFDIAEVTGRFRGVSTVRIADDQTGDRNHANGRKEDRWVYRYSYG